MATAPNSLLSDSAAMFNSMIEIEKRLIGVGDQLLGPEPREAGGAATPEPIPTVRRNLDNCDRMIGRINEAITRIESRV